MCALKLSGPHWILLSSCPAARWINARRRIANSSPRKGLVRKSSAPALKPSTFSLHASRAVRINTGILTPASRQAESTARPGIFGKPRSSTLGFVATRRAEQPAILAVEGLIDDKAFELERTCNLGSERAFILDEQHFHKHH